MSKSPVRNQRSELIRTEWIVLVGESIVAIGSVIVVVGLIKAFQLMTRDE